MKYPRVLPSYKDPNTWRVVQASSRAYGVVHPGHAIPYGMDWIADCATFEDARERAEYAMESDALMESI